MALGYTYVDFAALEQAINQLKAAKEDLATKLKNIKGKISGSVNTPDIYMSQDARVTEQEFETMYSKWAPKFDQFVQEYIDYFNEAKKIYEQRGETETKVAKSLNTFID